MGFDLNNIAEITKTMDVASCSNIKQQRVAILALEASLLSQEQIEIPPTHLMHGGMYARAVTVPAGTLLTGNIYKYDHIEVMTSGKILVTTDDGQSRQLSGFHLMPALSGKKRAAYAIDETTWITFHTVGNADNIEPDDIQNLITCETFEDLDQFYVDVSRADYQAFLDSQDWSEDQVSAVVESLNDYDDSLRCSDFDVDLRDSKIHGKGMFALTNFKAGDVIMPARINNFRTQAGRYINHAVRANAEFVDDGANMICVATKSIGTDEEITVNYRQVMNWKSQIGDLT